ncbi:MAG: family 20 glycosylhydrolase [Bacilli bacterium]|nr:family 20 glycosylhydrolase [Bacilli bacterium]
MKKLFPGVQSLKVLTGTFNKPKCITVYLDCENVLQSFVMFNYSYKVITDETSANLSFIFDSSLNEEGYKIKIGEDKILVSYKTTRGAFYSLLTLDQILQNDVVPCLEIDDYPSVKVRGFMLDISRDKVAKVPTIKKIIDLIASLKMNHFELYVEGFSYEYQSFSEYLEKDGYITKKEYSELEEYAFNHFVDFVPNQNGFGHMDKWLRKEELKDLAVCPDGIFLWGRHRKPTTLDPLDPKSLELVKKLYSEMLPGRKSKYFNMNFDEPFELGHGKTEGMDVATLYTDYMLKVYKEIKKYDKLPLIWGDVLIRHPDKIDLLPKDMTFIDWGYDASSPFERHAKMLKEKKVDFMTAPGTTSWCSFFGRYIDWYENIKNAIDAVVNNDGVGVLLTDWGDFGHLQFLPVSYGPIVYMGLYSWRHQEGAILSVRDFLNDMIYHDKNQVIGDLLLDLAAYDRYDSSYGGNGTRIFYTFMWACCAAFEVKEGKIDFFINKTKDYILPYTKYQILDNFFKSKLEEIKFIDNNNEETELTIEEIKQTIKTIKMIAKVSVCYDESLDVKAKIKLLEELINDKEEYLGNQKKLWRARNKEGGLASSVSYLEYFYSFIGLTLDYLKTGEKV